jgi:hypothetical protein
MDQKNIANKSQNHNIQYKIKIHFKMSGLHNGQDRIL